MARIVSAVVVIAVSLLLVAASDAAPRHHGKTHIVVRRWHGYGFLPGYRPPEQIEWQRSRNRGPYWWYGYPQFYHGRWNGGGFGPCWTQTPIGLFWNCGK
jgi:hypothetical protein